MEDFSELSKIDLTCGFVALLANRLTDPNTEETDSFVFMPAIRLEDDLLMSKILEEKMFLSHRGLTLALLSCRAPPFLFPVMFPSFN